MKYRFVRDASAHEWPALPRSFKQGDVVERFQGHTYGCVADDARNGRDTVACCDDPNGPFFTVPVELIEEMDGSKVLAEYVRFGGPIL